MTKFQVTRRRMLGSTATAGALVAAAGSSTIFGTARAQSARKTFILVHGAFAGGWIWRRVADRLEQNGHKVFVPTLTGLGERSHLLSKDVNLDTHIADIVNLIQWESLENVCLVVHSYGGFPGAGALEGIGSRVSSIVWLDTFIPANGQKLVDIVSGPFAKIIQTAVDKGEAGFGGSPPGGRFRPFLVPNAMRRSWRPSSLRNRLAPSSSRSKFPERSKRWRRKRISASQSFHRLPLIRH